MVRKKQWLLLATLLVTLFTITLGSTSAGSPSASVITSRQASPQDTATATPTPCTASRPFTLANTNAPVETAPVSNTSSKAHLSSNGQSSVGKIGKWQPAASVSFILDDGAQETAVGFNDGNNTSFSAIWMNRFSLSSGNYPLFLNQISIQWPNPTNGGSDLTGKTVALLVYADLDGDSDPANATKLLQSAVTINVVNGTDFQDYAVNVPISGPGDVYIGFSDTYNSGGASPITYPAPLDQTTSQHRSWLIGNASGATPDYDNLGNDDIRGVIDDLAPTLAGNFVIRASGQTTTCITPVPTDTVGPTNTPTETPTITPTYTPAPPTPTATDCANVFTDITGNIFYTAIHYLACGGVVSGTDATHYTPGGSATRAQFAKVVVLGFNITPYTPVNGGQNFTDVASDYFAYPYIETGYNAHILVGFDYNTCSDSGRQYPCYIPERLITRAQLTSLVVKADNTPFFFPSAPTYSDVLPSSVFYVSIESAHHAGIINGYPDGTFRPNNNIRRDEMAQIVYKSATTP